MECYLLDSNKIHGRFSAEELQQMHRIEHEEREKYRSTEDFQCALTKGKIQEIVSNAEAAFPDHPGSNHKRVSSISVNRKEEIEAQYQQTAQPKEVQPETTSTAPVKPESGKSRIQRMLEEALDEALRDSN